MDSLYIVMPAYNEEEIIADVVKQWYFAAKKQTEKFKIVVADSGSVDRTHQILEDLKIELPNLETLSTSNKLHGPKLIALYNYAIGSKADYVFQTDSDGQTNPNELNEFWNQRESYDAVFGNRTNRGDGKLRALVESVVCAIVRLFFGVKVPDANAPFRLFKCKSLAKYLCKMDENYNLPNIMLVVFFSYYGENILFKEITFNPRKTGHNSINIKKIVKIGIESLKDFKNFKKEM